MERKVIDNFDNLTVRKVHLMFATFWFCAAIFTNALGYSVVAGFLLMPLGLIAFGLALASGKKTVRMYKKELGL